MAVNCASLPEGLLESELFGHEKGSFTGAVTRKIGKVRTGRRGTILLDEVSEMEPSLQAKLLRVLQESEVDRVGGKMPVKINVRVVATTNRDLKEWSDQGHFRQDLYYRLNVIPLTIPPLRDRPADLSPLAEHFLTKYAAQNGKATKPPVQCSVASPPGTRLAGQRAGVGKHHRPGGLAVFRAGDHHGRPVSGRPGW